ncbi:MAG: trigger factor [Clostridiales bacterium]|jgi:trigger factor|nr:trigger factor [Clostridiales bacterium]
MTYTIEEVKGGVKLAFDLNAEEWESELTKAYHKNKGKYNIPGFRKGRASRKLIESMFGGSVFFDDAFNEGFYGAYRQALIDHPEIFPVDDPKVDLSGTAGGGIQFTAEVTVKPEVTLGPYKGLKLDKAEYPVSESDVEKKLETLREDHVRRVEVTDRPVRDGDTVKLDYAGRIGGDAFSGGTAENQELVIGSDSFIPGFETQVIGMAVGETKDIQVTFPEDYHADDVKGKDAVFTVKVLGITEKQYPTLDDRFIQDVSSFDTLDAYVADVRAALKADNDRRADSENENALIEKVAEGAAVELPDCMIESQLDYLVQDFETRLNYMYGGIKLENYLKYTGSNMADFRAQRRADAERDVKIRLTVEAVIKAESLTVTPEELDAEIAKVAEKSGKTAEDYKKTAEDRQLQYIENDLLMGKLMTFLKENNTLAPAKKAAAKAKPAENQEQAKKPAAKKAARTNSD